MAAADWGDASDEEGSFFFERCCIRESFEGKRNIQIKVLDAIADDIGAAGRVIKVSLTVFGARLPPREGLLGPNRSKKLILTGWPLALRNGAIMMRVLDTARVCVYVC